MSCIGLNFGVSVYLPSPREFPPPESPVTDFLVLGLVSSKRSIVAFIPLKCVFVYLLIR